ncbi:MAG: AAA family ATPase [Dehalococcoidales bacterium]|nr:AAA family ATPase [Dehalococcoidales bacterium]
MRKVVAIVGMPGSGKSEAAGFFEEKGFIRVRFGDITDDEIKKRGLEPGENSERYCRELLRKEMGMAAYAVLVRPRIDAALEKADVVADGLYSWEEYLSFKSHYGDRFFVVAIFSSPQMRYSRLTKRTVRPLTMEEATRRDISEIENLNKGGPIAMANYTIINELQMDYLRLQTEIIIARLGKI